MQQQQLLTYPTKRMVIDNKQYTKRQSEIQTAQSEPSLEELNIFTTDPNTMIGTWFNNKGEGRHITARLINKAVKDAVTDLHLDKSGLPEETVGSHSLRAGGAMALHLNNVSDNTIKKIGK